MLAQTSSRSAYGFRADRKPHTQSGMQISRHQGPRFPSTAPRPVVTRCALVLCEGI